MGLPSIPCRPSPRLTLPSDLTSTARNQARIVVTAVAKKFATLVFPCFGCAAKKITELRPSNVVVRGLWVKNFKLRHVGGKSYSKCNFPPASTRVRTGPTPTHQRPHKRCSNRSDLALVFGA